MKAKLRIAIVAVIALIVGGVVGDTIGARDTASHFADVVQQLALVHAAGEASVYSQVLRSLREGDEACAVNDSRHSSITPSFMSASIMLRSTMSSRLGSAMHFAAR